MYASGSSGRRLRGFTLMEVLVTLVLLSIIASVALPYAELNVRRGKEIELRRALREIRTAIDRFHDDWKAGLVPAAGKLASTHGYPASLEVLVDGVRLTDGRFARYLRRVPPDPFGEVGAPVTAQWRQIGYLDGPETSEWNREDVYDVHSRSESQAIDKSFYRTW